MYSIVFTFLQLIDIWLVSTFGLLWLVLFCIFLCKYLKTCFSILWIYTKGVKLMGGICGSAGKRIRLQYGRLGFDPWVGKICWRREQLPTSVFLLGEFHGLVHGVAKSWTLLRDFHFHPSPYFVLYLNLNEVLLLLLIYGHYSVRFTCIYLFLFLHALFLSISMFLYNYLPWAWGIFFCIYFCMVLLAKNSLFLLKMPLFCLDFW